MPGGTRSLAGPNRNRIPAGQSPGAEVLIFVLDESFHLRLEVYQTCQGFLPILKHQSAQPTEVQFCTSERDPVTQSRHLLRMTA